MPDHYDPNVTEIDEVEVDTCTVCKSNDYQEFTTGYDYELQTCSNEWKFVECIQCGCLRLNPRPSEKSLSIIYPPHYYSYSMDEVISPIALWGKQMLDGMKFKAFLKHAPASLRTYLDVGCGDGKYLDLLVSKGLEKKNIYGLELSNEAIGKLKEKGYQVWNERVEECDAIERGSMDLITMFHVIEHVADPDQVVKKLASWLFEEGILVIETPNIDAWDARLFTKHYWGGYHIPRHWHLFTTKNLCQLLENNGLDVVVVRYQTGHSFWMYSLHHYLKYEKNKPGLAKWFDPLKGLLPLIFFTGLDKIRGMLGWKTSAVLIVARKKA